MLLRRLLVATLLLAACGGPDPVPFRLKFTLGVGPEWGCEFDSCQDYPMGCGAKLGVRVLDPEPDVSVDAGPEDVPGLLALRCILVPAPPEEATQTLCDVDQVEAELDLPPIPIGMARIEVALGQPPVDNEPVICPPSMFSYDLQGIPRALPTQPAFGGAAYVDIGTEQIAEVRLACPHAEQLNETECLPGRQRVGVGLDDLDSAPIQFVFDGTTLTVESGEPFQDTTVDPPQWIFRPGTTDSEVLDLLDVIPARWEGDLAERFDDFGCVLVTQSIPGPITAVTCTRNPQPDVLDGHYELKGLHLPDETLGEILDAAGVAAFPPQGMVIGRVVDRTGQPLAGVRVTPQPSTVQPIRYVVDDGAGNLISVDTTTQETRVNGYFISFDAQFATQWMAQHLVDNRTENGVFHAGLIANKLSVVLIRMGDPPI